MRGLALLFNRFPVRWQRRFMTVAHDQFLVGVVGTLTGFAVGTVICFNVESIRQFLSWVTGMRLFPPELYFLSRLPAEMDVGETAAVVVMALTLSLLATLYPSWRAARLDPVEALRYE